MGYINRFVLVGQSEHTSDDRDGEEKKLTSELISQSIYGSLLSAALRTLYSILLA